MRKNIDYLRLSVTDRCNLNCFYCTPLEKSRFLARDEVLSYEQMRQTAQWFVKAGIRKLRITGGEPLIKKDFIALLEMLKSIHGLEEISLTTNGVRLKDFAKALKDSGLNRVNVSLDTLKKDKFSLITGKDAFGAVWEGILAALKENLSPVKLNVLLIKGVNDDEIEDFAALTLDYPLVVRFIEFFPVNKRCEQFVGSFLENAAVMKRINNVFGEIERDYSVRGNGPAQYFRIKNAKGYIGFISGSSSIFCDECNRVRVDCAGRIRSCLFAEATYDLRPFLSGKIDEERALEYIKGVLANKSNFRKNNLLSPQLEMSSIGG